MFSVEIHGWKICRWIFCQMFFLLTEEEAAVGLRTLANPSHFRLSDLPIPPNEASCSNFAKCGSRKFCSTNRAFYSPLITHYFTLRINEKKGY